MDALALWFLLKTSFSFFKYLFHCEAPPWHSPGKGELFLLGWTALCTHILCKNSLLIPYQCVRSLTQGRSYLSQCLRALITYLINYRWLSALSLHFFQILSISNIIRRELCSLRNCDMAPSGSGHSHWARLSFSGYLTRQDVHSDFRSVVHMNSKYHFWFSDSKPYCIRGR